ncbi:DUF4139 domain-containing protein [Sphingomonas arenae]|uniref:DUF4139 domain-containing protein n=1 Tax=Sphingomonas arenae TaxID=2812555 RepID=UPI001F345322|nr:hypothetical protein [Sphingomonas arenae]
MRRRLLWLGLLLASAAHGQTVATSAAPDRVAVTIYRDLNRGRERPNLQWLNGYALITETRRVQLRAGSSELRFEGVAGGILPQSAIITGLPNGFLEKNRDAYLLSPGTLLDRSLGRRVQLRRTDRATGRVIEQEALVRSGADGAVVLQTSAGFEALRCSGLAETLVYPEVPPGLSAKPTLAVAIRTPTPVEATVSLSYLASGFDWQANYVASLSQDERTLHLSAWLTLANGDETSFFNADTQAVAGRVNREDARAPEPEARPLQIQCWPAGTTSDIAEQVIAVNAQESGIAPPPPPPPPPSPERGGEDIVVTGSRVMEARRERLGDLQLYRIPEPVTVAANSQKQVALMEQPSVKVSRIYRQRLSVVDRNFDQPAQLVLVTRNRAAEGLGLPLPAGGVSVFGKQGGRPILIGEGAIDDLAVGEDVELTLAEAPGVRGKVSRTEGGRYTLRVTNDRPVPVHYEAELFVPDDRFRPASRLDRRNGRPVWKTTVPANGSVSLSYRISDED